MNPLLKLSKPAQNLTVGAGFGLGAMGLAGMVFFTLKKIAGSLTELCSKPAMAPSCLTKSSITLAVISCV